MYVDSAKLRRVCCSCAPGGCRGGVCCRLQRYHPEGNDEGGGVLDSPTHEADQEREQQNW